MFLLLVICIISVNAIYVIYAMILVVMLNKKIIYKVIIDLKFYAIKVIYAMILVVLFSKKNNKFQLFF